MKKLMVLFAAVLFAGITFACEIPDGWSYYTQVRVWSEGQTTVIRSNVCGEKEYRICFGGRWCPVYHEEGHTYYFYTGLKNGDKVTFTM